MAKLKLENLHMEDAAFRYVANCPKDEIGDDFFSNAARKFRLFDRVKVYCPDPKGFWFRVYWAVSDNPVKFAAEGNWKRVAKPEEAVKPAPDVGRTSRQVFVPVLCDPGDLNENNELRGAPVRFDDAFGKVTWDVIGVGTGKPYRKGIETEAEAWEVIKGQKPYDVETMERAA